MSDAVTFLSLLVACAAGVVVGYRRGRLSRRSLLKHLQEMEKHIMETQLEVAAELRALKEQVVKIKTEVTEAKNELAKTIKSLEDIIAAGNTGEATAELVTVKDELKAELQTFDDLHLDKPSEPPV